MLYSTSLLRLLLYLYSQGINSHGFSPSCIWAFNSSYYFLAVLLAMSATTVWGVGSLGIGAHPSIRPTERKVQDFERKFRKECGANGIFAANFGLNESAKI